MMTTPIAVLAASLLLGASSPSPSTHVALSAEFVPPAKAGANAHVAVTLSPRDADVRVNEEPAPRLKLEADEAVLVDKQAPPTRSASFDPQNARYLDPALPVHFPVAVKPTAARGKHTVKARVTYFYCSKREGWCRKGTDDVEFAVDVR
jgi:hypothetical protein